MSGVEAAVGLALAVLPLLVSAIEHYDTSLRPFIRYKHLAREADRYLSRFQVQKVVFKNSCKALLHNVIDQDSASRMVESGTNHRSWGDSELDRQLSRSLSGSKDVCVTVIRLIEDALRDLEGETKDLKAIIDQDPRVCPHISAMVTPLESPLKLPLTGLFEH